MLLWPIPADTHAKGASAWLSLTSAIRRWHRLLRNLGTPPTVTTISATRVLLRWRSALGTPVGPSRPGRDCQKGQKGQKPIGCLVSAAMGKAEGPGDVRRSRLPAPLDL